MHLHILACRVLTRHLSQLAATSDTIVDITWLPQGMHEVPSRLNEAIKHELASIHEQLDSGRLKRRPDYIALGYGLCSKAVVGVEARDIPLVVPRCDDCIALFLGSQKRYLDYFESYPGTYWLNSAWVENSPEIDEDHRERLRERYMEQYDDDEDTVEYLLSIADELTRNYRMLGYIGSEVYDNPAYRERAEAYAREEGLEFKEFEGSLRYLRKLIAGEFSEEDFLVVPPGHRIEFSSGPEKMIAVALDPPR